MENRNKIGIAAVVLLVAAFGALIWTLFCSKQAKDIGFAIEEPSYLFGCYYYLESEIRLEEKQAIFNGQRIEISYGNRKTLREVFYPHTYPWFNPETNEFSFKNDRFELVDMIKDDDGKWTIQIWDPIFLESDSSKDWRTSYFKRAPCK